MAAAMNRSLARFTLLTALSAACGPSPQATSPTSLATQSAAEDGTFPVLADWHVLNIEAHEQMRNKGSSDPWQDLTTKVTGLVQVTRQGEKPELSFQTCRIILPEVAGITPTLADETVQA